MIRSTERSSVPGQRPSTGDHPDEQPPTRTVPADVHLQPLPGLEWSLLMEARPAPDHPRSPASLRRGWVHEAPEEQVLGLFRKLNHTGTALPAPWWMAALDRGELPSRAAAFGVEDEVHAALTARPGWVFVPWAAHAGESGFWEYSPSDRAPMTMPTTVRLTNRHHGWIEVVAAHRDAAPLPLPVPGVPQLLSTLPRIESW